MCCAKHHTMQNKPLNMLGNAIILCIENELNEEQIRIHIGNVTAHAHVWQNQFVTLQQCINLKNHEFVGQASTIKMNINHEHHRWHKLEHMRICCNWCHLLLWCQEIIDGYR